MANNKLLQMRVAKKKLNKEKHNSPMGIVSNIFFVAGCSCYCCCFCGCCCCCCHFAVVLT